MNKIIGKKAHNISALSLMYPNDYILADIVGVNLEESSILGKVSALSKSPEQLSKYAKEEGREWTTIILQGDNLISKTTKPRRGRPSVVWINN